MPIHNFEFTYLEYRQDGGYSTKIMQALEPIVKKLCKQDSNQVTGLTHEDLAQELRLHLWQYIPQYDPKMTSLNTWGYMVLNRKISNMKRDSFRLKRRIQYCINETGNNTGDEEKNTIRYSD